MNVISRDCLLLMEGSTGAWTEKYVAGCKINATIQTVNISSAVKVSFSVQPTQVPTPDKTSGLKPEHQQEQSSSHQVLGLLMLTKGFGYQEIGICGV